MRVPAEQALPFVSEGFITADVMLRFMHRERKGIFVPYVF